MESKLIKYGEKHPTEAELRSCKTSWREKSTLQNESLLLTLSLILNYDLLVFKYNKVIQKREREGGGARGKRAV